jgi:hypothetical protein
MSALHLQPHRRRIVVTPEDKGRLVNFLEPSHIAVIATVGPSGAPQLTPNWYCVRGGKILISTTKERVKYRGQVTIRDDESIWPDTQAIVERYVASESVEARMSQLRAQNRVILAFDPERVIFRS